MAKQFQRACVVYFERDGDRVLIASLLNRDDIWTEQPDGVVVVNRMEPIGLGEALKAQLAKCVMQPAFNFRGMKKADWPAFIASGARSITAFEKAYARYNVAGANEANLFWVAESGKVNNEFTLKSSINAHADAPETGEWMVRMHQNYLRVESTFE